MHKLHRLFADTNTHTHLPYVHIALLHTLSLIGRQRSDNTITWSQSIFYRRGFYTHACTHTYSAASSYTHTTSLHKQGNTPAGLNICYVAYTFNSIAMQEHWNGSAKPWFVYFNALLLSFYKFLKWQLLHPQIRSILKVVIFKVACNTV